MIECQIKANEIAFKTEEKKLEVSQQEDDKLARLEKILKQMENYSSEQRDKLLHVCIGADVQHAKKKKINTQQAENISQIITNH